MRYAELQVTSHFSFLRGASGCDELFTTAKALGIEALGIVDRNSLAGIVRAWEAAKETGVRLVVGCRLDLADGMSILAYPTDRAAYSRLCRLLSLGKERGGKGKCILDLTDVALYADGLLAVLVPDEADDTCAVQLRKVRDIFGDRACMALTLRRRPNDQVRLHELNSLAIRHKVRPVVTNDVLFHEPGRRQLQDVVTCTASPYFSLTLQSVLTPLTGALGNSAMYAGTSKNASRQTFAKWPGGAIQAGAAETTSKTLTSTGRFEMGVETGSDVGINRLIGVAFYRGILTSADLENIVYARQVEFQAAISSELTL